MRLELAYANFNDVSTPKAKRPFFVEADDPPSKVEILRAALHLFVTRGRSATTVREIADAAGYTNPALFKFFASKDDLARALFVRCYERASERFREAIDARTGFEARIGAFVDAFVAMLDRRHDADALLYVNEALRELWPSVRRTLASKSIVAMLRVVVSDGRVEGAVAHDLEPELVVAAILGILTQFARQHYFGDFTGLAARYAADLRAIVIRACGATEVRT